MLKIFRQLPEFFEYNIFFTFKVSGHMLEIPGHNSEIYTNLEIFIHTS